MWAALGKPAPYHELRGWPPHQKVLQEEKREPLRSKNKGPGGDKGARKKKPPGSRVEKAAAVGPRVPTNPALQRGEPDGVEPGGGRALVHVPEALAEELTRALVSMDMAMEQEYAWDIFTSMMKKQSSYIFQSWDVPRAVTAEMRALIVDWLVQVHPAELCFMTEDSFSRRELLRMERKVLSRLNFELHYTNPVHLLQLLVALGRCAGEVHHLAMYFMELSLMEADCVKFEPAQLAAAALCLAQRVLQEADVGDSAAGPEGSMQLCLYSEEELGAVHHSMAKAALRAGASNLRAVFLKYSHPQKLGASTSPAIARSDYLTRLLGDH
ncbi:cyclin-P isoform X3 [Emydura macquarii macquarii]|uniref:cyclin-P isoform X3 n=1 Tax=Emydura macquarii macquarii TaxID=1129001 RepID=UPI00352A5550